jgi:hypothetical protein
MPPRTTDNVTSTPSVPSERRLSPVSSNSATPELLQLLQLINILLIRTSDQRPRISP